MSKFNLPDDLYSYQKEDVDRLLSSSDSYLNLSEMGTGKTPVAIGLSILGNYQKTLIICPKSLQLEWARQIGEWTDIVPDVSKKSSYYRKLEPLFRDMMGKSDHNPFFIINYEAFRAERHREILNLYPFDLIIMDEGHRLRNQRTSTTKGIFDFLSHKEDTRVLILTGSPIVNNPADLHTLLRMVKPERYNQYTRMEFIRDYCFFRQTRYGIKVTGVRNMDILRENTASFTIRRTKKEALPFLPEKYHRRVLLEMEDKQEEVYKKMLDELFVMLDSGEPLWAPTVLAQLTRLRQLNLEPSILGISAPSAKTDFIKEFLEDTEEKVVIFSCFEKYINHLHNILPYKHIVISGKTPAEKRVPMSMEFNEDPSIRLCLATIGPESPGGEGLTLTGSSNVIFSDRWWTPTTNTQAEDRLHRITQKSAVQVILPITTTEGSIDEALDKILETKRAFSTEFLDQKDVMREVVDDLRRSRRQPLPPIST